MFGKKRSKQRDHQLAKQALILEGYLVCVPLIRGQLNAPAARAAAQVFILGMADMLRQTEKLSWDDFVTIYRSTLDRRGLLPKIPVDEFMRVVSDAANGDEKIEQILIDGARSLREFVVERGTSAPIDLLLAIKFAESNEEIFAAIQGVKSIVGEKRSEPRGQKVPKQAQIINDYLAGVPLTPGKLNSPAARGGAQVFIYGMAELLTQDEMLSWDDLVAIYRSALDTLGLLPEIPVDAFAEFLSSDAERDKKVEQILIDGANSINRYISKQDESAPSDLLRAIKFAESNEANFLAIYIDPDDYAEGNHPD